MEQTNKPSSIFIRVRAAYLSSFVVIMSLEVTGKRGLKAIMLLV